MEPDVRAVWDALMSADQFIRADFVRVLGVAWAAGEPFHPNRGTMGPLFEAHDVLARLSRRRALGFGRQFRCSRYWLGKQGKDT